MKKEVKFKVGDRVARATSEYYPNEYSDAQTVPLRYNPDNELELGEVVDVSVKGKLTVKWDDDYNDSNEVVEAADLLTEEEGKAKWNSLEADFKSVEKEVKAKMKEVAKGIKEAQKLAQKVGYNVADMYGAYGDLYSAMDGAGWRTSSFGC
jgi:hypothetical protein